MSSFSISKGYDIRLAGRPAGEIEDHLDTATCIAYPLEFEGVKQRLLVNEGDRVKRGTPLIEDKKNTAFKICAPAGGTIQSILRGERRFVDQIIIQVDKDEQVEDFGTLSANDILSTERSAILDRLQETGYLSLIRQRPFSIMADPATTPKSIFINAMNTGPFRADANVVADDDPVAFQAGINLMTRLTDGKVHLCAGFGASSTLKNAENVEFHEFSGPHPSGNTSVHISRVDPIRPGDHIWTVKAVDLVLLGRLFLDGKLPASRVVSLGGSGVKEDRARHYRLRMGSDLNSLLDSASSSGEARILNGDILSGTIMRHKGLGLTQSAITVLPEGRERHFLGWLSPGAKLLSLSRAFLSGWKGGPGDNLALNTNRNGGHRALVLTGNFDRVMPLDIMTDYLIRAVMAGETDEAIKLGLLEVDPEDFALCDFVCPCKTEVQAIIRKGLEQVMEEEGI